MRNAKNILRHELIGLQCRVTEAKNRYNVGLNGKIVDETMKTLLINKKRIAKQGNTFTVNVSGKDVKIDGTLLVARPEDRIKKKFKKW